MAQQQQAQMAQQQQMMAMMMQQAGVTPQQQLMMMQQQATMLFQQQLQQQMFAWQQVCALLNIFGVSEFHRREFLRRSSESLATLVGLASVLTCVQSGMAPEQIQQNVLLAQQQFQVSLHFSTETNYVKQHLAVQTQQAQMQMMASMPPGMGGMP